MGAVEENRRAIQDFSAPELRTVTAKLHALAEEQARLRSDIEASEGRMRAEIMASEIRVIAAIDRLRADLPLPVRNAVLEQLLAEKQSVIDDFQKQAH